MCYLSHVFSCFSSLWKGHRLINYFMDLLHCWQQGTDLDGPDLETQPEILKAKETGHIPVCFLWLEGWNNPTGSSHIWICSSLGITRTCHSSNGANPTMAETFPSLPCPVQWPLRGNCTCMNMVTLHCLFPPTKVIPLVGSELYLSWTGASTLRTSLLWGILSLVFFFFSLLRFLLLLTGLCGPLLSSEFHQWQQTHKRNPQPSAQKLKHEPQQSFGAH